MASSKATDLVLLLGLVAACQCSRAIYARNPSALGVDGDAIPSEGPDAPDADGARAAVPMDAADAPAVETSAQDGPAGPDGPAVAASHPGVQPGCEDLATPLEPRGAALPRELWRAPINWLNAINSVVLSRDRVYVTVGESVQAFSKAGKPLWTFRNGSAGQLSAPTVDPDGNVYVASDQAVALDAAGDVLWSTALLAGDVNQRPRPRPFVLSPDGVLYSAQSDGRVVALDRAKGIPLWTTTVGIRPEDAGGDVEATGGFDDLLVVNGGLYVGYQVLKRNRGTLLSAGPATPAGSSLPLAGPIIHGIGVGGYFIDGYLDGGPRVLNHGFYTPDAQLRWSLPVGTNGTFYGPRFVDLDGNLVVLEGSNPRASSHDRWHWFSCTGRNLGAVDVNIDQASFLGDAVTLGGDGVAYTLTRSAPSASASQLVAFDENLRELWRLPFEGQSPPLWSYGPTLDEDGTLYFVLENAGSAGRSPGTAELVAIRTTSPGLARSRWPTYRHDSQGTSWAK
jgi:outer membrane protein assembly factor BamB